MDVLITITKWVEYRKQKFETKARLETRKKELDIHMEKEKKRIPPTIKNYQKPINKVTVLKKNDKVACLKLHLEKNSRHRFAGRMARTNKSGFSKESLSTISKLLEQIKGFWN